MIAVWSLVSTVNSRQIEIINYEDSCINITQLSKTRCKELHLLNCHLRRVGR